MAWYREERKVLKSPPYTLEKYSDYWSSLIRLMIQTERDRTHILRWPIL
jgi:hypothetical protein